MTGLPDRRLAAGAPSVDRPMIVLRVMGTLVGIRVEADAANDVATALRSAWDRCLVQDAAVNPEELIVLTARIARPGAPVHRIDDTVISRASIDELMNALTPRITVAAIDAQAGSMIMMHACGFADPATGATVALVGRSGMGKTTLSARLGASLGYVTDETVAVLPGGGVLGYPKPLSVKRGGADPVKDQISPTALGLLAAPERLHLAAIVLLDRQHDAPREPVVSRVPLLEGVMRLAPELSHFARTTRPLQLLDGLIEACGGVQAITYRESEDAVPLIRSLLKASA